MQSISHSVSGGLCDTYHLWINVGYRGVWSPTRGIISIEGVPNHLYAYMCDVRVSEWITQWINVAVQIFWVDFFSLSRIFIAIICPLDLNKGAIRPAFRCGEYPEGSIRAGKSSDGKRRQSIKKAEGES